MGKRKIPSVPAGASPSVRVFLGELRRAVLSMDAELTTLHQGKAGIQSLADAGVITAAQAAVLFNANNQENNNA